MPKQVDHEQRRQEIVAATWLALEDVGLDGTTMREIALRAECTTGRLNHYFESRDAIIVAALRQVHSAAAHRMLSALDGRTGIDALRAVLLESLPLDAQRRREWKVWLAFWSRASTDDALKAADDAPLQRMARPHHQSAEVGERLEQAGPRAHHRRPTRHRRRTRASSDTRPDDDDRTTA